MSLELIERFGLNAVAVGILIFGLYYRRYRDKDLVTAACLFNVFAFCVLSVLGAVEFSVAAGFGLFAILALFTLRSEPLTKIEMTYFFGSVAIAVITAVQATDIIFAVIVTAVAVLGAWIVDHPKMLSRAGGVKVNLDRIDSFALSDAAAMKRELSKKLGVTVTSYQVIALDYVTDVAKINVQFINSV